MQGWWKERKTLNAVTEDMSVRACMHQEAPSCPPAWIIHALSPANLWLSAHHVSTHLVTGLLPAYRCTRTSLPIHHIRHPLRPCIPSTWFERTIRLSSSLIRRGHQTWGMPCLNVGHACITTDQRRPTAKWVGQHLSKQVSKKSEHTLSSCRCPAVYNFKTNLESSNSNSKLHS